VTDEELVPLANATVRLGDSLRAATDSGGAFEFVNVPAGTYEAIAEAVGHGSQARKVQAVAGGDAAVSFQLAALAVATEYHITRILKGYMECSVFFIQHFNLEIHHRRHCQAVRCGDQWRGRLLHVEGRPQPADDASLRSSVWKDEELLVERGDGLGQHHVRPIRVPGAVRARRVPAEFQFLREPLLWHRLCRGSPGTTVR
jgi:hypothetical protein